MSKSILLFFLAIFFVNQAFGQIILDKQLDSIKPHLVPFLVSNGEVESSKILQKDFRINIYKRGGETTKDTIVEGLYWFGISGSHSLDHYFLYENNEIKIFDVYEMDDFVGGIENVVRFGFRKNIQVAVLKEMIGSLFQTFYFQGRRKGRLSAPENCKFLYQTKNSQLLVYEFERLFHDFLFENGYVSQKEQSFESERNFFYYRMGIFHGIPEKNQKIKSGVYWARLSNEKGHLYFYAILSPSENEFYIFKSLDDLTRIISSTIKLSHESDQCYGLTLPVINKIIDDYNLFLR